MWILVVAHWSNFRGQVGRVVKLAFDHVMVVFEGDDRPVRFGLDEVAATPDTAS